MSDASLIASGTEHFGWTDIRVTRSMEQLVPTFDLSFTERWTGNDKPIPIREGDPCELFLGGKSITKGYVDDASVRYSVSGHTMRVAGRAFTGDLVDCAAKYGKGRWANAGLLKIAKDLLAPFQISVTARADLGDPFKRFAIEDGESVHDTLERACRMRGVIMMTTAAGHLAFDKVAVKQTKTTIELGVNVLEGTRAASWKDRFSEYTVKGQAVGENDAFGLPAYSPKAVVTDAVVNRYRPTIIQCEIQGNAEALKKRAAWERNIRAGRAQRLTYVLDGWENAEGLWEPNVLARVKDEFLQVDTQLLIVSVEHTKGNGGTSTTLELCDPMAMTVQPLTQQPKGKAKHSEFVLGSKP